MSPWTAFDHPQLGRVEIGGIDYMRTIRNPPTHLLSDECRHGFIVADQLRRSLPQTQFKVTLTTLAPSVTRIEAHLENLGFLSTASSERAKHLAGTPTVNTALTLEGDLILESGAHQMELPHLEGWGSVHPQGPHSVYPSLSDTGHRTGCSWIVKGSGDFQIEWSGGRGGMGRHVGRID